MKRTYMLKPIFMLLVLVSGSSAKGQNPTSQDITSPLWKYGYLDIHHINTGRGNAAFSIFPDGTTLLVDAGDIVDSMHKSFPLTVTKPYPDNSTTSAGWIVDYIRQVAPADQSRKIDYALITHFHGDHFGVITNDSKKSKKGNYKLSGITEVGELIPISKMIDRNYPDYNYPTDLQKAYDTKNSAFMNYLQFTRYHQANNGLEIESLKPGSIRQIVAKYQPAAFPEFKVYGIKANASIWTGKGNEVTEYFTPDSIMDAKRKFNENPLSLAIKISYGMFDYFTGGDNTGLQGYGLPEWFDVETHMSKAVGKVEVTTLNHHGNRDATNENFLRNLQPQVVVEQTWCSDHPGQEVMHRLISDHLYKGEKNIFATNIQEVTKHTLGFWFTRGYKSMLGHVIIRVLPGGEKFYVLIAETIHKKISITKVFGPYRSS